MTASELLSSISPSLGQRILEEVLATDKELYRVALAGAAQARKVRPVFLERQSKPERHRFMLAALTRADMNMVAGNVISGWLVKNQQTLLTDFLNALKIPHQNGVVEDLPEKVDDAELKQAVDLLLGKHPPEVVALYLHAFYSMNEANWPALDAMLHEDDRLALGR
jgi:hypothetical protein